MSKLDVLVVDDDPDIRSMMVDVLSGEGYSVCEAENGLVALGMLAVNPVRLILLDMMMPVMNGWEFLAVLNEKPNITSAPIVLCTASRCVVPSPAVAMLHKPFTLELLLALVEQYCRLRHLRSA